MAGKSKSLVLVDRRTIAQPDRRYWGTRATYGSELRFMYSIGLLNLDTFQQVAIPGADPANEYKGRGEPWFTFPTPPQQYEISEPAATTIIPTQDGGKYVESQGNIFKEIRISGTVGLRPNPVSNELFPELTSATGVSLQRPSIVDTGVPGVFGGLNDERGLRPAEITGLDDITFLRNIFRAYFDLKKQNEFARKIVMVWMYAKESEWYIVEPISFTTTRSSANPLSWSYNIQLRTLYRFDTILVFERDPIGFLQKVANIWKAVGQTVKDIARAINQINNAINYAIQLPFRVVSQVLATATNLLGALADLRNTKDLAKSINRRFLITSRDQLRTLRELRNRIQYGEAVGDKRVFGDQNTNPAPAPTDAAAIDIHRDALTRAFVLLMRAMERLHALDALFSSSKQVAVTDYSRRYTEDGEPLATSGSPLDPNNIIIPESASEVEVDGDIRSIAKKYMGDESFWKTIAILNGLKYPYIGATSSPGVLSVGDKILIPKRGDEEDISDSVDETVTDASQQALSPILKKYGRDLKLKDSSSGVDFGDIEIGQGGDLAVVEGVPNVQQAIKIKFSTELGDLPVHPTFGAQYPIGTKLLLGRVQEFAINTRRTLLSDPRVDSLERIKIFVAGDVLQVSTQVKLKQSDVRLPIEFAVRRG